MKLKLVVGIGAVLSLVAVYNFVYLSGNNKKIEYKDMYNDVENTTIEYAGMQEIRASKDEILEKIRNNEYRNIVGNDVNVFLSTQDSVSKIKEESIGLYKGIEDAGEMLDLHLDVVHKVLGNNIDEKGIYDTNSIKRFKDGSTENIHLPELKGLINIGKYSDVCVKKIDGYSFPGIGAWSKENKYMQMDFDFNLVLYNDFNTDIQENFELNEPLEIHYDPVGVYYPEGKNLEDKYKLNGKEISVGEAIEFVGNYLSKDLGYDISMGAPKKIARVEVYEIEGNTAIQCYIAREMEGMMTEYGTDTNTVNDSTYEPDLSRVILVEVGKVYKYCLENNTLQWKKIDHEINQVVSFKSALDLVSAHIGKNSVYELNEVSMAYREKNIDGQEEKIEYEGEPNWVFRCKNQNDGKKAIFYVDMLTGEVSYNKNL